MTKFKVPQAEIENRISKIQKELQDNEIDGILIVQRMDLYYFSGTAQAGVLYIPAEKEPLLLIKKYFPRAKEESPLKEIIEIKSIKELPERIIDNYRKLPDVMGFELDVLPVNEFYFYQKLFNTCKGIDASPLILKLRIIKSAWEIEQMEKTAELSRKNFEHMKEILRPGLTEIEFAAMCETFARKHGHGGLLRFRHFQAEGFPWHILSGKSGGMVGMLDAPASGEGTSIAFPCGAGHKKIKANEPIMADFGSVLNGYHVDETRMFALESMPEKAHKASVASIEIHNCIIDKAKPGVTLDELFSYSVNLAKSLGFEEQYLGPQGYKVNFVAHGVGLEMAEPPYIAKGKEEPLQPGMTFALEPKLVFQNEFAAGIESVFLVTKTGSRLITKVPVEIFII